MDTQIAERVERSIGDGPEAHPSLEELIAEGRRAVRRHHVTVGSAAASLVAAVAIAAAALGGGRSDRAGNDVVQQPSSAATDAATKAVDPTPAIAPPPTRAEVRRVLGHLFVDVDDAGRVTVSEGTVLRQVDNPFDVAAPANSLALEIQVGGGVYWYARYDGPGNQGGEAVTYSGTEKGSFRSWLERVSGLAGGQPSATDGADDFPGIPGLDLVSFAGGTEQLTASQGVTILEQRAQVSVGDSFAEPGDRTAAAEVRTDDGKTYYVLARAVDGEDPQYIAVPAAKGGADLDAFLEFARERYAGGAGLL